MMKINRKLLGGIKRKIALISLVTLLFNTAMVGLFVPSGNTLRAIVEEQMCEAAVDVVLVMDRSGSMAWDSPTRLSQAKTAANSFLGNLGTNDQSALVSYASSATLDKELSDIHLDSDGSPSTETAVNALVAEGGTNIGEAIAEGTAEFSSGRENNQAVKVMILLTDGRATCPFYDDTKWDECGRVEDQEDIDYAIDMAEAAALEEIKIFTIGLGSDVNSTMLQNIATATSADYYFAPDGSALEGIYDEISTRVCEFGSISGCKYSDVDKDGDDTDFSGEDTIFDWEIILGGDKIDSQQTDQDGCYEFAGLLSGTYTVSEGSKDGVIFEQTYPLSPNFYTIDLAEEESAVDKDFGNYLPYCGNEIVDTGYLGYDDEACDDGNTEDGDGCSSICQTESPINPGDVIINELMWMGSEGDPADEWIELKNTTQSLIEDLNGCKLYKKNGGEIADLSGLTIDANGYLVVSRKNQEDSNISIAPDLLSSSISLSNTELEIKLICGETLIDVAGDGYAPLAGSNEDPKKSMQLCGSAWIDALVGGAANNWDIGATELGTPGLPNVCEEEPDLGSLTICKQEDLNGNGILDGGEPVVTDPLWKFYIDSVEHPADEDGCITINEMPYGEYNVVEETVEGWVPTGLPGGNTGNGVFETDGSITVIIGESNPVPIIYFLNQRAEPVPPECEDEETEPCEYTGPEGTEGIGICKAGIKTCVEGVWGECSGEVTPQNEICGDGLDNDCDGSIDEGCGGGGGGGGVITKPTIIITNEAVEYLGGGEALVTWTTNIETTRQVAYGDDSVTVLGAVPEYGYDSVNEESTGMTKEHSVTIGGLVDGVVYYFRPIADRSGSTGERVGIEVSYELGEVEGIEAPAPVECNYLLEYIKLGADNNPVEVKKLEWFLNEFEGESLAVNGIYEQVDFDAVSRFQEKYFDQVLSPWNHDSSTGYVYITTKKRINELYCEREFPLTSEQESEVSAFSERFLGTPAIGGEVPDLIGDSEASTAEDMESGEVGGVETEEGEELVGIEGEEDEHPEEIKIDLEDGDEDEEATTAYSDYSRYILIILALIILALAYRFYNSRKTKQGEDVQ